MEKITVLTRTYNTGKYICKCVESVLNQTWKDICYVIIDNASTDNTVELLKEYERKDSRIRLILNDQNNMTHVESMRRFVDTEYFFILDHDDWLEPDALERMYQCAKDNNVEMVFGPTKMWDDNGREYGIWGLQRKLIMKPEDIPTNFASMYWQFRTVWGVLMHKRLISCIDDALIDSIKKGGYAVDTVKMLNFVFAAKGIATVPEVTHNYLIHAGSESTLFRRYQFYANWRIYDIACEFLERFGEISQKNMLFLNRVYCTAICDTIENDIKARVDKKLLSEILREIITDKHTQNMMNWFSMFSREEQVRFFDIFGDNAYLIYVDDRENEESQALIVDWMKLLYRDNEFTEPDYEALGKHPELLRALMLNQWEVIRNELWDKGGADSLSEKSCFYLIRLSEGTVKGLAERLLYLAERGTVHEQGTREAILGLAGQNLLLRKYEKDFWIGKEKIAVLVCMERHEEALSYALDIIDKQLSLEKRIALELLELALKLSAVTKNEVVFVAVRKLQFVELYNCGQLEKAGTVLADLWDMCPEDDEVKSWKQKLTEG